jgi:hypothetical protein
MAASIRARLASSPVGWRAQRQNAAWALRRRRRRQLLAGGGGLGGELLGFFLLLALLAEVLEFEAVAGGVGRVFFAFAGPDLALGEAEVVDQRDVGRADEAAAAAFDAVEEWYSWALPKFFERENQYISKGRGRPGRPWRIRRSGCRASRAAGAEQSGPGRSDAVGGLDHRHLEGRHADTHHRAAHDVRSVSAAGPARRTTWSIGVPMRTS